jgi:DNA repair exonuclease SbcCD ATPase subunit
MDKLLIDEVLFKLEMENMFNVTHDRDEALKLFLIDQAYGDDMPIDEYLAYKMEMQKVTGLNHFYDNYVMFNTDKLDKQLSELKSERAQLQTTIDRNVKRIATMDDAREKQKKWATITDKVTLMNQMIEDIKQTKVKFDNANGYTAELVQQGKNLLAERNMREVDKIQEQISNLEYNKAVLSEEIVWLKKNLTEAEPFDEDAYDQLVTNTNNMNVLIKNMDKEIESFHFYITSHYNNKAVSIHNEFKSIIGDKLKSSQSVMNNLQVSYDLVNKLMTTLDIGKYLQYEQKLGLHRCMIYALADNKELNKKAVTIKPFDEFTRELMKQVIVGVDYVAV